MKVGFIGLGLMGGHMATNISRKYPVVVATRTPGKAVTFVAGKANMEASEDVAGVAKQCSIVILCVTDSPDVVNVAHGGLFEHAVRMGSKGGEARSLTLHSIATRYGYCGYVYH